MVARVYNNTAPNTTISTVGFTASSTYLSVVNSAGYPTIFPFTIRINPGAPDEEIIDVIGPGSGTDAQPWQVQRAKDGTFAKAWAQGTPVVHGFSARDFNEIQSYVANAQSLISNSLPVGSIILWSGPISAIPKPRFALCDGTSYNPDTGGVVTAGTVGAIVTPDLRGRFIYGAGTGPTSGGPFKNPGDKGGSNALTSDLIPSHTHTISSYSHTHTTSGGGHVHDLRYKDGFPPPTVGAATGWSLPVTTQADGASDAFSVLTAKSNHTHSVSSDAHTHTVNPTGSQITTGTSENNMPSYYALAYIMLVTYNQPLS